MPPTSIEAAIAQVKAYEQERDTVLRTLDEQKIRAFFLKHTGKTLPTNQTFFWAIIHKTITAAVALPLEFRQRSKDWLTNRELHSHDEGDLLANK